MDNLANYDPDDIIRLALANRGYGYKRFMGELFSTRWGRKESQILRLFEIHKHETGINPFEILQDPSKTRMITREEWNQITGGAPTPRGSGLATARTSKLNRKVGIGTNARNIPLHPQEFHWLDVEEIPEEESVTGQGSTSHMFLMDYAKILELHDLDMKTEKQIAEITGNSLRMISSFFEKLRKYDQEGVADEWLNVLIFLWNAQVERGSDHFGDDLMMDLRGIFKDFVKDPIHVEPPTDADLHWVYNQLLSEEE